MSNNQQNRARRTGARVVSAFIACVLFSVPAGAQSLTVPVSTVETVSASTDVSAVPAGGLAGLTGSDGRHNCSDMTWGEACAKVGYGFPQRQCRGPRRGRRCT